MSVLVLGEHPWVTAWLTRRHSLGLDRRDEVWAGVLHVSPLTDVTHGRVAAQVLRAVGPYADAAGLTTLASFALGDPRDYRVPDGGWCREVPTGDLVPTTDMVLEVLSDGDETDQKLGFYAVRAVSEVLIADPSARTVTCLVRRAGQFTPSSQSILNLSMTDLQTVIRWP